MSYSVIRKPISGLNSNELRGWRSLLKESSTSAQVFLSPEFCNSINEIRGGVQVILVKEGESVRVVLPVQKDSNVGGMLGAFSQVGLGISDFFDIIADTKEQYNIARICKIAGIRSLFYTHAPSRVKLTGIPLKITGATYRIVTCGPADDLWAAAQRVNSTYWGDATRKRRKLEKEFGPVEFSWHEDSLDCFDLLIDAKLSQYKATGHPNAPLFERGTQEVLRSFLKGGGEDCKGVMSVLRAGGRVVALHFGLRTTMHLHNWFPVYIGEYSRYSPGKLLFMEILKNAKEYGVTSFDFGEGGADYKTAAANEVEELGKGLLINGVLGTLSTIPRRVSWRLKQF